MENDKLALRLEKCRAPGKEIRFGCAFGGQDLVVIQMAQTEGNEALARELRTVLEKENIRRAYIGLPLIAYKIETSGSLTDRHPDVAAGGFKLTEEADVVQQVDMGRIFFPSSPVGGEE